MPYSNTSSTEKYGTASRTVTLPLSSWAQLYESAEIMKADFRTTMIRAIALLHAQEKRIESEISE